MYINETERTVLGKVCYWGPPNAGKATLLRDLYDHHAAVSGEHTHFESKAFVPPEELVTADAAAFVSAAERAFDAPYEQLTESGTLVWMRARISMNPAPNQYHRTVDVFSATGDATADALRMYSIADADCVVFVADAREEGETASIESWEELRSTNYRGPVVLLVNHAADADGFVERFDFEGPAFSENDGFDGNLDAFQAAAKLALELVGSVN